MRFATLLILCCCAAWAVAQTGGGSSAEERGFRFEIDSVHLPFVEGYDTVRQAFKFVVIGDRPVEIDTVLSSCACAIPDYPPHPVAPGDSGVIYVEFAPYKPGPFDKSFTLKTDGYPQEVELRLTGYVAPTSAPPEVAYPVQSGGSLRLKTNRVHLGSISTGGVVKRSIELYNASGSEIHFLDTLLAPEHIGVVFSDSARAVQPYQRGSFTVFYQPGETYGYTQDKFALYTDEDSAAVELTITAVIQPYVAENPEIGTDQLPELRVANDTLDLGRISEKAQPEVTFVLRNEGEADLEVLRVEPFGFELLTPAAFTVQPAGQAIVKARLYDDGRPGTQFRYLTVYSNDPEQAIKRLFVLLRID